MSTCSGAHLIARALEVEGVRLTFGDPVAETIPLVDVLAHSGRVRPTPVAQEAQAARMAIGAWHASQVPACVLVAGDLGVLAAIPGLAEAGAAKAPLLMLAVGAGDTGLAGLPPFCRGSRCPDNVTALYQTIRRATQDARRTAGPIVLAVPTAFLTATCPDYPAKPAGAERAPAANPVGAAPQRSSARSTDRESLLSRLMSRLGPTTRVVVEGASSAPTVPLGLGIDQALPPGNSVRIGSAIPIAIGAKLAAPTTPVLAVVHEDGFLVSGTELITAVSTGAAVIVAVLRPVPSAKDNLLPRFDSGSLAEAIGAEWIRLERGSAVAEALDYMMHVTGHGRPVVLEAVSDEPTGERTTPEAATGFRARLARWLGQPDVRS